MRDSDIVPIYFVSGGISISEKPTYLQRLTNATKRKTVYLNFSEMFLMFLWVCCDGLEVIYGSHIIQQPAAELLKGITEVLTQTLHRVQAPLTLAQFVTQSLPHFADGSHFLGDVSSIFGFWDTFVMYSIS